MCYLEGAEPHSSCLLCLVRVNGAARLVPSCATPAEEGMEVESDVPEVFEARKLALELLLGDHLGECRAPCQRICPLSLDVPRMTRQVRSGDLAAAIEDVRRALPFPGVLGRVCPAKCEIGCRRGAADAPVSIREIERHVADADREGGSPRLPRREPATGRRVAVVGGGPAGLSAAYFLSLAGHAVTVFERAPRPGGRLRHGFDTEALPPDVLDAELEILPRLGAEIRCGVEVGKEPSLETLLSEHDAVLVAAAGVEGSGGIPELFAAGDAVRRLDDPVKAMASGKDAAAAIHARLSGGAEGPPARPFSTVIGRLTEPEIALYLRGTEDPETVGPPGDPKRESARCMRCDCRATADCLLKKYAEEYGASPARVRVQRRLFSQDLTHPFVIYEPGKCIACGICVTLTREAGEELGLTFVGRGFDVRVGVPFDAPLARALRKAAREVVVHCPTGALAFRDGIDETGIQSSEI
jgi:hypothetical protein